MPSIHRWPDHPPAGGWRARSYGNFVGLVQALVQALRAAIMPALLAGVTLAGLALAGLALVDLALVDLALAQEAKEGPASRPVRLVALGDSLTTGLGLPADAAFPARLQQTLRTRGLRAEIADAGVSGDTAANGLARLDWAVPDGTDGVIVALGANDMLRGIDPALTRKALDSILSRLAARKIAVLLAGMRAAPNLGKEFASRFDPIYPELAARHGVVFHPFLLEGVAADSALNQRDGIHPTAAGVEVMVAGILPKVEELIGRIRAAQSK